MPGRELGAGGAPEDKWQAASRSRCDQVAAGAARGDCTRRCSSWKRLRTIGVLIPSLSQAK